MAKQKIRIRDEYAPDKVLNSYREMRKALPEMNERELLASLELERIDKKRPSFIELLHRRFSTLRQRREQIEYGIVEISRRHQSKAVRR